MAYAPHELVRQWRDEADGLANAAGTSAATARKLMRRAADELRHCADDLERYHHEDNHDAEWCDHGCPYCDAEMAERDAAERGTEIARGIARNGVIAAAFRGG